MVFLFLCLSLFFFSSRLQSLDFLVKSRYWFFGSEERFNDKTIFGYMAGKCILLINCFTLEVLTVDALFYFDLAVQTVTTVPESGLEKIMWKQ